MTEVYFRVDSDEDASRIAAVLGALGYAAKRDLAGASQVGAMQWSVEQIARYHKLTSRERDIFERVTIHGQRSRAIADALEISRATVKWHMHNIFVKTNTGDREALLRLMLQLPEGAPAPNLEPRETAATVPSKSWF